MKAWVRQIMGLPVSIHARGEPDARLEGQVAEVFAELRHADAVFSPYRDDSDLSRWDRGELPLDDADPRLAEVLALADEARERTGGWFDPRGLPDPRTGAPRYDPSGLVKGWAVQRAARHLTTLDGWCLNAGGDVLVHAAAGEPPWRVGIEDPDEPSRLLRVVTRSGGAVATSGTAHRGTHIVDPHTGRPATRVRAATVLGPELLWADVYATALVAEGPRGLDRFAERTGYTAMVVSTSGLQQATANWP